MGPGTPLAPTQPRERNGLGLSPFTRSPGRGYLPQNGTQRGLVLPSPIPEVAPANFDGCPQLSTDALGTAVAGSHSMCRATGKLPWGCAGDRASGMQGPRLPRHRVQGADWCMCMPGLATLAPPPRGHKGDKGNGDRARAGQQRDMDGHGTWCPEASGRGTRLASPGPHACHRHGNSDGAGAPGCSPGVWWCRGGSAGPAGLSESCREPWHPQQCARVCVCTHVCSHPTLLRTGATGATPAGAGGAGALEGHRDRDAEPALVQCRRLFV